MFRSIWAHFHPATEALISVIRGGALLDVEDRAYGDPEVKNYCDNSSTFGELEYWGRT